MPYVTLRIEFDGKEETLSEYHCDWPDCPNPAVRVVGAVASLKIRSGLCAEHAARISPRKNREPRT